MSTPEMFVRLLGSIRDHLVEHPIDTLISSVETAAFDGGVIEVRLNHDNLGELATALLAWADTLTSYAPSVLRSRHTDHAHLRISGQLPDTTWIGISGSVPYTDTTFGDLDLQPGEYRYLNTNDLITWAVAP